MQYKYNNKNYTIRGNFLTLDDYVGISEYQIRKTFNNIYKIKTIRIDLPTIYRYFGMDYIKNKRPDILKDIKDNINLMYVVDAMSLVNDTPLDNLYRLLYNDEDFTEEVSNIALTDNLYKDLLDDTIEEMYTFEYEIPIKDTIEYELLTPVGEVFNTSNACVELPFEVEFFLNNATEEMFAEIVVFDEHKELFYIDLRTYYNEYTQDESCLLMTLLDMLELRYYNHVTINNVDISIDTSYTCEYLIITISPNTDYLQFTTYACTLEEVIEEVLMLQGKYFDK